MSPSVRARVRCSCGHVYEVEAARHLHVTRRPEVRQAVLDGTFHRFACDRCGKVNLCEEVLAYTDFARRQWFTLFPAVQLHNRRDAVRICHELFDRTMVERAPPLVQSWSGELTQRAIFGFAALRDKLVVLEAGLDDRLVEIMKLRMFQAGRLLFEPGVYLCCTAVAGDELVFEYADARSPTTQVIRVPRREYVRMVMDHERHAAFCRRWFGDIFVDYRVALVPDQADVPVHLPHMDAGS